MLVAIEKYDYNVGFFFNDTATTEIYTLSLHDALPISGPPSGCGRPSIGFPGTGPSPGTGSSSRHSRVRASSRFRITLAADRKSTRLNSSHANISYAVFCLKKK